MKLIFDAGIVILNIDSLEKENTFKIRANYYKKLVNLKIMKIL